MALNIFKKKKNDQINYLDLTPVKKYNFEIEENGFVSVLIPRFTNKFLVRYLSPRLKSPYVKAKLDEFGSQTWLEIDGVQNVHNIAQKLLNRNGEKIQPINERLTKFLTQLYNYNFITFNELNKKGR